MVDPGRINVLLERLEEEVTLLEQAAKQPAGELLGDANAIAAVTYRLVVAIEICIDVGEHVIASEGLRAPDSFAAVFDIPGEAGYLEPGLAESLGEMAKFRNLLVHVYERVDDRRVIEILGTELEDFQAFREQIAPSALK